MTLLCSAKRGSLSTRVDRRLNPTKENPVQLNILNEVAALQRLTVGQLRQRFAELFGEATPASNRTWLIKRIAWRLQALAEGDLSERARQFAREIATDADLRLRAPKECVGDQPAVCVARASLQRDPRVPVPGTQLIKRYKNETLTVTVLEDGYQYGERVYKSLSAIARQVTGTQWNGYLFFGLGLRQEQGRGE